jgi:hypothetical protein
MNSKPHRTNSNFHLKHFIAGSCHTADGAWAILYEQGLDIAHKIECSRAQGIKREAKILEAEEKLADPNTTRVEKMRAEADIIEAKAAIPMWEMNHKAAEQEHAYIVQLMADLEPHRQFKHLPILEANEAMQRGEWLGELKTRVENFLLTAGTIPHDHLEAMRCHPNFESDIVPHIKTVTKAIAASKDGTDLLTNRQPLYLEDKS